MKEREENDRMSTAKFGLYDSIFFFYSITFLH